MCCAPCATAPIERLLQDGYKIGLFFSNSNIYPFEEYKKRLNASEKLSGLMGVYLEEDEYEHEKWLEHIRGLESEPEKGIRCSKCFAYSLKRTAQMAEKLGYSHFTTTLTLGPHKVSSMIFAEGENYSNYIPFDFKKKDGYKRSLEMSNEMDIFRQNYCGCEFSMRDSEARKK
ncbi:MAG: hypothetical protein D6B28_02985 [Gammaproteobacteria bacterium]|nr:MAG: hypothetical protein D6B28_02985 [Gammaproteobacteria bacterium]